MCIHKMLPSSTLFLPDACSSSCLLCSFSVRLAALSQQTLALSSASFLQTLPLVLSFLLVSPPSKLHPPQAPSDCASIPPSPRRSTLRRHCRARRALLALCGEALELLLDAAQPRTTRSAAARVPCCRGRSSTRRGGAAGEQGGASSGESGHRSAGRQRSSLVEGAARREAVLVLGGAAVRSDVFGGDESDEMQSDCLIDQQNG